MKDSPVIQPKAILSDSGGESKSRSMEAFASKHKFIVLFASTFSTSSGGLNECNYFTIDETAQTLTDEEYTRRSVMASYVQLQQPNKEKWYQSNPLVFGKQNIISDIINYTPHISLAHNLNLKASWCYRQQQVCSTQSV